MKKKTKKPQNRKEVLSNYLSLSLKDAWAKYQRRKR